MQISHSVLGYNAMTMRFENSPLPYESLTFQLSLFILIIALHRIEKWYKYI